ncbi:MAG: YlcI/YnfO family protein [Thermosynechococcaceae cyanobacterium]
MSRLTLRLPETLHQQLAHLAESEGVSLNQYIVYALTRQVSSAYSVQVLSEADVKQQEQSFSERLQQLGKASSAEIQAILAEREIVEPEEELSADVIHRLQQRIQDRTSLAKS